jgi:hypothetical protein
MFIGYFHQGVKHGPYVKITSDGNIFLGIFENGSEQGRRVKMTIDGRVRIEVFKNGMIMRDINRGKGKPVGWEEVIKEFYVEPVDREKDIRLPNRGNLDETINSVLI